MKVRDMGVTAVRILEKENGGRQMRFKKGAAAV